MSKNNPNPYDLSDPNHPAARSVKPSNNPSPYDLSVPRRKKSPEDIFREFCLKDEKRDLCPCPKCGKNQRQDCGYGVWHYTMDGNDFDCDAPVEKGKYEEGQPCDDCYHVWCDDCKEKWRKKHEKTHRKRKA